MEGKPFRGIGVRGYGLGRGWVCLFGIPHIEDLIFCGYSRVPWLAETRTYEPCPELLTLKPRVLEPQGPEP